MIEDLSKMELVSIGRQLGVTMGDYARATKESLVAKLLAAASRDSVEALVKGGGSALISGIVPAPVPVPSYAPPVYDIKVVATVRASKAFPGVKGLADVEVELWNDPGAPEPMADYRFNPKHLKAALSALKRGRPMWLGGPAGTGKTEFVRQLCARLGRGFLRVQFDASLEAYHVIGGERAKAASTVWQDGLVLQGFRRPGCVILLDEVGFARPEYTSSLHAALEPIGIVTIPETGEVVKKGPGVTFFAADNSNGRGDAAGVYAGLREQNNAFLSRFAYFAQFAYLPADEEAEIIVSQTGANPALARLIADFLCVARSKAETGALESPPTMREAFYLAEALLDGIAPREAYELAVVNRAPLDCHEILQQLWAANVDANMIEDALKGNAVVLKTVAPVTPTV